MSAGHVPKRCRSARRGGAVTVEFALTAPILLMLLFALLEFGRYNMILQTANNAAFEAARACVVPGALAADAQARGQSILQAAMVSGGSVQISPGTITSTTAQVTATVTVPLGSNMWFTPLFHQAASVQRSCQMTRDWVNSTRNAQ